MCAFEPNFQRLWDFPAIDGGGGPREACQEQNVRLCSVVSDGAIGFRIRASVKNLYPKTRVNSNCIIVRYSYFNCS